MLEHFFGSFHLTPSQHSENSYSHIDEVGTQLSFHKLESANKSLIIYTNRPGIHTNQGSTAHPQTIYAVAGHLGLDSLYDIKSRERASDEFFASENNSEIVNKLSHLNGTFALVARDSTDSLLLATDSLGARPLYFAQHSTTIYFSTSYSLIVEFFPGALHTDEQAVAEQIKFCFPLGKRTLSSEISVLRDGEYLIAKNGSYATAHYIDWRQAGNSTSTDREYQIEYCASAFASAVASRSIPGNVQYSLLSGGLDSRMIVSKLLDNNHSVVASNRSYPESLDQQFCIEFAEKNNVAVSYATWGNDRKSSAGMTTAHVLKSTTKNLASTHIFSGDGGGEIYGLITIDKELLEVIQNHGITKAINLYVSRQMLAKRLVTTEYYESLEKLGLSGLHSEFDRFGNIHPEKAFQLFFLTNELRRHLHDYFDSTELETKELLLPFYDRRVIESVVRIAPPFQKYIGHKFYYELAHCISPRIHSVVWQTYPWSEPCPIPSTSNGIDQWALSKLTAKLEATYWRGSTIKNLFLSKRLPIFRYSYIFAAIVADLLAYRGRSYIFKQYISILEIYNTSSK